MVNMSYNAPFNECAKAGGSAVRSIPLKHNDFMQMITDSGPGYGNVIQYELILLKDKLILLWA